MSQKTDLLNLFRSNRNTLTLNQILNTSLAAEYRARMTDLRKEGYIIVCERAKKPSENIYTLVETEQNGQIILVGNNNAK